MKPGLLYKPAPPGPPAEAGVEAVGGLAPPWLTFGDAARLLAVSDGWLRAAVRSGIVPSVKVGGLRRFRPKDLQAWIDGLPLAGPADPTGGELEQKSESAGRIT
jgi:excisionase family DNA binding protein